MKFDRITHDPRVMGGKSVIRGMRVTVGTIAGQIGSGATVEQVLIDYPYLEREDVLQALRYAAWRAEERTIGLPPLQGEDRGGDGSRWDESEKKFPT